KRRAAAQHYWVERVAGRNSRREDGGSQGWLPSHRATSCTRSSGGPRGFALLRLLRLRLLGRRRVAWRAGCCVGGGRRVRFGGYRLRRRFRSRLRGRCLCARGGGGGTVDGQARG